uniref:PH domain-containing protein n=1 Tax=Macrostomum lignano TaxID=282301 RepID=A0A1I8JE89_9PLAT
MLSSAEAEAAAFRSWVAGVAAEAAERNGGVMDDQSILEEALSEYRRRSASVSSLKGSQMCNTPEPQPDEQQQQEQQIIRLEDSEFRNGQNAAEDLEAERSVYDTFETQTDDVEKFIPPDQQETETEDAATKTAGQRTEATIQLPTVPTIDSGEMLKEKTELPSIADKDRNAELAEEQAKELQEIKKQERQQNDFSKEKASRTTSRASSRGSQKLKSKSKLETGSEQEKISNQPANLNKVEKPSDSISLEADLTKSILDRKGD